MPKVEAVVLAAGLSSRMKKNKLLLELNDKKIIQHVLQNIQDSYINRITVVVGHEKERVMDSIREYQVRILDNPDYAIGMSTSLKTAVKHILSEENSEAIMIFTGDMPFIKVNTINAVIDKYKKTKGLLDVPRYNDRRGHPVLIDKKLLPELLNISGDVGARLVLQKHQDKIEWVDVDDHGIHFDIDSQDVYHSVLKKGVNNEAML